MSTQDHPDGQDIDSYVMRCHPVSDDYLWHVPNQWDYRYINFYDDSHKYLFAYRRKLNLVFHEIKVWNDNLYRLNLLYEYWLSHILLYEGLVLVLYLSPVAYCNGRVICLSVTCWCSIKLDTFSTISDDIAV